MTWFIASKPQTTNRKAEHFIVAVMVTVTKSLTVATLCHTQGEADLCPEQEMQVDPTTVAPD